MKIRSLLILPCLAVLMLTAFGPTTTLAYTFDYDTGTVFTNGEVHTTSTAIVPASSGVVMSGTTDFNMSVEFVATVHAVKMDDTSMEVLGFAHTNWPASFTLNTSVFDINPVPSDAIVHPTTSVGVRDYSTHVAEVDEFSGGEFIGTKSNFEGATMDKSAGGTLDNDELVVSTCRQPVTIQEYIDNPTTGNYAAVIIDSGGQAMTTQGQQSGMKQDAVSEITTPTGQLTDDAVGTDYANSTIGDAIARTTTQQARTADDKDRSHIMTPSCMANAMALTTVPVHADDDPAFNQLL